jgi:hypothetical protein
LARNGEKHNQILKRLNEAKRINELNSLRVVCKKTLRVDNLPKATSKEKLESMEYFGQYGKIDSLILKEFNLAHSGPTF